MLTREGLAELYREFRDIEVLSVYIDAEGSDPGDRRVWALEVERRLDDERTRLEAEAPGRLDAFEAARESVDRRLEDFQAFLPGRGWVAFATPDRLLYAESISVPMPNLVRWEKGLRVAPYVRGLKQDRLVTAVLADRRRARLFTYRHGELEEHVDLIGEPVDSDQGDVNVSKRAATHSGVRGQTSTDAARATVEAHATRLHARVAEAVEELTRGDGFVVLGGTHEVVSALARQLSSFGARMLERPSMHFEMNDADIRASVEEAASELSRRAQSDLVAGVFDLALSGGNGCVGARATRQALQDHSVDTLLLTRAFREREPDFADHCVGAAFDQNSAVEELSGSGAERLDREGEGIGARLRFTVSA